MANIKTWLDEAVKQYGEPLEAVVVGQHDNARWDVSVNIDEGVVLPVEVALKKLDVDFDNGYGGADCFPVYAWTQSRVFFVHEYDGATGLNWIPRNPQAIMPTFGGEYKS